MHDTRSPRLFCRLSALRAIIPHEAELQEHNMDCRVRYVTRYYGEYGWSRFEISRAPAQSSGPLPPRVRHCETSGGTAFGDSADLFLG